jgi:long-chain acyl-CoA synthetase
MELHDVVTPQQAQTLHGLFVERAKRTPQKIAYRHFENNAWSDMTWQQASDEVARWQVALTGLNLARGDRVAIMLRNCPSWVIVDQAALSLGLVVVPLYTVDRPDNLAYIIGNADAKVLVLETAEQWQSLLTVREQLQGVQRFVSLNAPMAKSRACYRQQNFCRYAPLCSLIARPICKPWRALFTPQGRRENRRA